MKNEHMFTRYLKFVESIKDKEYDIIENHHILPKSMYPELKNDKDNIIAIGLREHYICHLMLAKIFGGKMWYALNLMQRAMPEENKNSFNYKSSRKYILSETKKINTGRKHSIEFKENCRARTVNTLVVKNIKTGEQFRTSKNEMLENDDLVFYRTGYKHQPETIARMKNNGLKNRKSYTDGNVTIFLKESEEIPFGFRSGRSDEFKEKMSAAYSDKAFYHDENGKTIRLKPDEKIPTGFTKGRLKEGNFCGWDKLNQLNKVFNLKTKRYELVEKLDKFHVHFSGVNYDKVKVYSRNGKYCLSRGKFLNHEFEDGVILKHLIKMKNYNDSNIIDAPIRKNTPENIINLRNRFNGCTYSALDVIIVSIAEYKWDESHIFIT